MQIAGAHAAQLAWWEGCNLRHIGLVQPATGECLSSLSGDLTEDDVSVGVQLWIDEGPGDADQVCVDCPCGLATESACGLPMWSIL